MNSVLGMNFFVFCFLVLIVVFYFSKEARDKSFDGHNLKTPFGADSKEAFGMSPGTLDQLASTSVPKSELVDPNRKPDQDLEDHIQANLTNKGMAEMSPSGSNNSEYASA
jgi:hypothetical protein